MSIAELQRLKALEEKVRDLAKQLGELQVALYATLTVAKEDPDTKGLVDDYKRRSRRS